MPIFNIIVAVLWLSSIYGAFTLLQILLLHLSKENSNNPYYASTVPHDRGQSDQTKPRQQLGHRPTQQRPEILQVHDLNNPNMQPESTQPDSVRLPLLSLKPCRVQDFGGRKVHDSRRPSDVMDDQRLAEIRQNDQRWSRSVPLLNNRQEQITHEPSGVGKTMFCILKKKTIY